MLYRNMILVVWFVGRKMSYELSQHIGFPKQGVTNLAFQYFGGLVVQNVQYKGGLKLLMARQV